LVYIFLFFELYQNKENIWQNIFSYQQNSHINYFWWALVLMPVNWLLESIKWQYLIKKVENVGIIDAYQAVLAGTAISIFTPNRVGDYLGRIFILKKGDRLDGTVATIVGNLSQLLITIIMGSMALVYFLDEIINSLLPDYTNSVFYVRLIIIIINISVIFIFFQFPKIEKRLNKTFELYKYPIIKHLNLLSGFKLQELLITLGYSFFRFFIYSTQFYLLFLSFNLQIGFSDGMLMIFLIFFAITIVPSIAIAELGIRGIITITLYQILWGSSAATIDTETILISATSFLWLINIAIPAILGGLFIFKLRFIRKSDDLYLNKENTIE